uniref:(northern house mosquito) hypothetical protein n=1 Tax=Culex pipiens TaxID=7175 RepID=A0A8D8KNQ8_CULPI
MVHISLPRSQIHPEGGRRRVRQHARVVQRPVRAADSTEATPVLPGDLERPRQANASLQVVRQHPRVPQQVLPEPLSGLLDSLQPGRGLPAVPRGDATAVLLDRRRPRHGDDRPADQRYHYANGHHVAQPNAEGRHRGGPRQRHRPAVLLHDARPARGRNPQTVASGHGCGWWRPIVERPL